MGSNRAPLSDGWRFALAVIGSGLFFLILGRTAGEPIARLLQETPTTLKGWLVVGWLVGGPPYLLTGIYFRERGRMGELRRKVQGSALGVVVGASMFIFPARLFGVDTQYGTGAIVGNPLTAGWVWGVTANVVIGVFAILVFWVLRSTVKGDPSPAQVRATARFLEVAGIVALIVTLGLALYGGNGSGIFNNGT
jgi:hypothetical protein